MDVRHWTIYILKTHLFNIVEVSLDVFYEFCSTMKVTGATLHHKKSTNQRRLSFENKYHTIITNSIHIVRCVSVVAGIVGLLAIIDGSR